MRRALLGQVNSSQSMRVPPGTIVIWPGTSIPKGWLLCDGNEYRAADYPALYSVIGTTYGTLAAGYFMVPNIYARVVYGVSAGRPLNTKGGSDTHQLTAAQSALRNHTHTHEDQRNTNQYGSCNAASGAASTANQGTYNESTVSASSGASAAHTNLQPYIDQVFIIKT